MDDIKEEYYKLSLTYLPQNKWKSVEKFAKKTLRIDQNDKEASILLQKAYYQQGVDNIENGRYCRSINLLQKAKDIHPNCEKTHYHLGLAYFKRDRLTEARVHAKKALSIQPSYSQARKLLSVINNPRNWLNLGGEMVRRSVRRVARLMRF